MNRKGRAKRDLGDDPLNLLTRHDASNGSGIHSGHAVVTPRRPRGSRHSEGDLIDTSPLSPIAVDLEANLSKLSASKRKDSPLKVTEPGVKNNSSILSLSVNQKRRDDTGLIRSDKDMDENDGLGVDDTVDGDDILEASLSPPIKFSTNRKYETQPLAKKDATTSVVHNQSPATSTKRPPPAEQSKPFNFHISDTRRTDIGVDDEFSSSDEEEVNLKIKGKAPIISGIEVTTTTMEPPPVETELPKARRTEALPQKVKSPVLKQKQKPITSPPDSHRRAQAQANLQHAKTPQRFSNYRHLSPVTTSTVLSKHREKPPVVSKSRRSPITIDQFNTGGEKRKSGNSEGRNGEIIDDGEVTRQFKRRRLVSTPRLVHEDDSKMRKEVIEQKSHEDGERPKFVAEQRKNTTGKILDFDEVIRGGVDDDDESEVKESEGNVDKRDDEDDHDHDENVVDDVDDKVGGDDGNVGQKNEESRIRDRMVYGRESEYTLKSHWTPQKWDSLVEYMFRHQLTGNDEMFTDSNIRRKFGCDVEELILRIEILNQVRTELDKKDKRKRM